jgi:aspartyl-tRNA(Asn)/glutamyl-tRNA(Gln) amidotransferase subunit C
MQQRAVQRRIEDPPGARVGFDLDPAEQATLQADLNAVLGLIDRLQSVDTQGVAPLTHPQALALRLRDDAVTESDSRAALQAGAPKVESGLYLVPRVIE